MKCKCSLNNNYEVIGLCDIKEFNKRIDDFQDESWTQITIPERLKLPSNKAPIKNITKVFLNIKLTSNKIVKTPSSEMPNIEGLNLTGKILLVSGKLCQNIIYISDTIRNSIHSVKFDIPFNTYIVVDEATDLERDSFCVYPCVEDVFLIPLDERTISKSVTLFLFAHRIEPQVPVDPPIPGIRKLPNAYIFKTFNNEEMAKIEFDETNKKLIVTSTGKPYKNNLPGDLGNNAVAFKFTLKDSNGAQTKITKSINENENADAFRDTLNEFAYEDNEKITVFSKDASKLILTNFPDKSENYDVPNGSDQTFEITPNSITPSVLPYKITVKSKNNEEVLNIQFNKETRKFIVSSTGIIPDSSSNDAYFTLMLKSDIGQKHLEGNLNSNENGSNFKLDTNNKSYLFINTSLILIYKDKSKIEISNYPNNGNIYVPNGDINIFSITNNRLLDNSLSSKIKILGDNNEYVSSIQFGKGGNVIPVATATGAIGTNTLLGTIPYVEFLHYSPSGTQIFSQILGKKDASDFASKFETRNVAFGMSIRLFNKIPNRIIITDYKNQGEYRIGEEPEFLKAQGNSLVPHDLNYNKIRLKNNDNSSVLYIYFDKLGSSDIYIEPYSTGKVNRDTDLFSFKITDSGGAVKNNIQGSVNKGDTADSIYIALFQNAPNFSNRFNFGDILVLEYSDKRLVEIFDFPFTQNPYNPVGVSSQKFRITQSGLTPINTILDNAFVFKSLSNEEMAKVQFDITAKKLKVTSTGKNYGSSGTDVAYTFKLKNSTGDKVIATINRNGNAQNFANDLNDFDFEDTDKIVIFSRDRLIAVLTNYPRQGEDYRLGSNANLNFKIDNDSITPNVFPNKITVKSINNDEVLNIQVNKDDRSYIVSSTGKVPDPSSSDVYFTLIQRYNSGGVSRERTLNSNENADNFKTNLEYTVFPYNSEVLQLIYKDSSKIEISNYPNMGDTYIPSEDINILKMTPNGLADVLLPNKIKILGDNNEEVCLVQFYKGDRNTIPVPISTGAIGTNNIPVNIPYVEFLQYDGTGTKMFGQILGKKDASDFASSLDGNNIIFRIAIRVFNKIANRIIITDYKGQNEYRVGEEPEYFSTDGNTLIPYGTKYNKIRLKNRDNTTVLFIYFDVKGLGNPYIEPYSTGKINNDTDSFSFKVTDKNGVQRFKIQGSLNKGDTADNIYIGSSPNRPNVGFGFPFGDILVLEYSDRTLVEISNFPATSPPSTYNPTGVSSQKFTIASTGLQEITQPIAFQKLLSIINIRNINGEVMVRVEFDATNKKIVATSTGIIDNSKDINTILCALTLNSNRAKLKYSTNHSDFINQLNNKAFEFGDILIIHYFDVNHITIDNYPNEGGFYIPRSNPSFEHFRIEAFGLVKLT